MQVIFDSMSDFMAKYKCEAIGIKLKKSSNSIMQKKLDLIVESGAEENL